MNCKPGICLGGRVLLFFCLASCASAGRPVPASHPRAAQVYITGRARFTLLPPHEIEKPLDGAQQIAGTFGGRSYVMDAWVKADEQGIDMEFYNSLGAGMGSFSFNREGVSFSSALFPSSFKAEYLAADFQLCFYRSGALERELAKSALGFGSVRGEAAGGEGGEIRRVFEGGETGTGKTLIEIEKTGTSVTYTNFVRGYSFTIRSAGEAR